MIKNFLNSPFLLERDDSHSDPTDGVVLSEDGKDLQGCTLSTETAPQFSRSGRCLNAKDFQNFGAK